MFNRLPKTLLPLLSGALMGLSWYYHLSLLMLVAWLPLLAFETAFREGHMSKLRYNLSVYFGFLLWNLIVSWWVVNASAGGAVVAFVVNSLFMTIVFVVYTRLRQVLAFTGNHWFLLPLWLAWEYGHTLWDLTWTWLTLGNVFSNLHAVVQWYAYTGASGGSAWVLASNILIYRLLTRPSSRRQKVLASAVVVVPIVVSLTLYLLPEQPSRSTIKVVAVQPNIDPYNEKFFTGFSEQFEKTAAMATPQLDSTVDLLLFPETFISENLNEEVINESEEIDWFRGTYLQAFPKLSIVAGTNSYQLFSDIAPRPSTARFDERMKAWYDVYNTGICISTRSVQLYHKSKLVPGVERMPFPALLRPLEALAIDMGGTMGSLGTQTDRSVFEDNGGHKCAPVICYESVYPDFVREYIQKGAQLITVITNDGWWGNTPGYRQHKDYARLRAIECHRWVVRSANTGTSCFIHPNGDSEQETKWWEPAVISAEVGIYDDQTFFVKHGDLLSYTASGIAIVLIVWRLLIFVLRLVTKNP